MSVRLLLTCAISAVATGCTSATTTADAAPAATPLNATTKAAARVAQSGQADQLGTLAGQSITLSDLKERQRGALVRHDAKAALDR